MHKEQEIQIKAVLQENLNISIENKPSTNNTDEGDCYGQVSIAETVYYKRRYTTNQ